MFIPLGFVAGTVMRGTTPAPIVPEMATDTDSSSEPNLEGDGGEPRTLPQRTYGAPLVPDCS